MSFPNHIHGKARVDKGREWGKRSAAKRKPTEPDWREICKRGAEAMRGQVLREGVSWTGEELCQWRIVRSIRGRTNQVDLVVGDWIRTGSMRTALAALRYGRWGA